MDHQIIRISELAPLPPGRLCDTPISGKPAPRREKELIRQGNIELLQRVLNSEIEPDTRRVLRRMLREQERFAAVGN